MLPQVGLKMAPHGLKMAQVGLKLAHIGSKWPQVGSRRSQVGPGWPQVGPKRRQIGVNLAPNGSKIIRKCEKSKKNTRNSMKIIKNPIRMAPQAPMHSHMQIGPSNGLQINALHVPFLTGWLMLAPSWLMLPPSWLMLAPSWLMWAPCWLMWASCWLTMALRWLQIDSRWVKRAPRWPQVGFKLPRDCLKNDFGGKLDLLEPQKTLEKPMVFDMFRIVVCNA